MSLLEDQRIALEDKHNACAASTAMGPQSQVTVGSVKQAKVITNPYAKQHTAQKKRLEMEAAANEKAPDAENRATQPAQQTKKRVDLGTKKCKTCSQGKSCHKPHDLTCKKSQLYKSCTEAIAKMPPVESKAIFSRLSNRKPTSDPLKQGSSGPMDAFVVPKATNSAKAPPAETSA